MKNEKEEEHTISARKRVQHHEQKNTERKCVMSQGYNYDENSFVAGGSRVSMSFHSPVPRLQIMDGKTR